MCSATNICHSAEEEREKFTGFFIVSLNLEIVNNFKNEKSERDGHVLLFRNGCIFSLPCSISITIRTIFLICYIKTIILCLCGYLCIPISIIENSETFVL